MKMTSSLRENYYVNRSLIELLVVPECDDASLTKSDNYSQYRKYKNYQEKGAISLLFTAFKK